MPLGCQHQKFGPLGHWIKVNIFPFYSSTVYKLGFLARCYFRSETMTVEFKMEFVVVWKARWLSQVVEHSRSAILSKSQHREHAQHHWWAILTPCSLHASRRPISRAECMDLQPASPKHRIWTQSCNIPVVPASKGFLRESNWDSGRLSDQVVPQIGGGQEVEGSASRLIPMRKSWETPTLSWQHQKRLLRHPS